jgi:hypothetical protein
MWFEMSGLKKGRPTEKWFEMSGLKRGGLKRGVLI